MSQANSDFADFGGGDFGGEVEYQAEVDYGTQEVMQPLVSPASNRKRGITIYTLFLILSLICLIAGSIFLFANVQQYQL